MFGIQIKFLSFFFGLVSILSFFNIIYSYYLNLYLNLETYYMSLIVSILISGILGVSRIKEQAHNNIQVYIGFIIGFFVEVYFILLF